MKQKIKILIIGMIFLVLTNLVYAEKLAVEFKIVLNENITNISDTSSFVDVYFSNLSVARDYFAENPDNRDISELNLKFLDSNNKIISQANPKFSLTMPGSAMIAYVTSVKAFVDYNKNITKIKVYYEGKEKAVLDISELLCNNNKKCDGNENYLSCADCEWYDNDSLCTSAGTVFNFKSDYYDDGFCDNDCFNDSDCLKENCNDGIKNQDEIGVDFGGVCEIKQKDCNRAIPISDNPIFLFKFQDLYYKNQGFWTREESGLEAYCANNSCPVVISGADGRSMRFDGVDDVLSIGNPPAFFNRSLLLKDFTISAWVNTEDNSIQYQRIAGVSGTKDGKNKGYYLILNKGKIYFYVGDGKEWHYVGGKKLDNKKWYYVSGSYNSKLKAMALYIDGKFVFGKNNVYMSNYPVDGYVLYVGANRFNTANFKGKIDELSIYNRSSGSLGVLYNSGICNARCGDGFCDKRTENYISCEQDCKKLSYNNSVYDGKVRITLEIPYNETLEYIDFVYNNEKTRLYDKNLVNMLNFESSYSCGNDICIKDSSMNSYEVNGGPAVDEGKYGKSIQHGYDREVRGESKIYTGSYSASIWFKPNLGFSGATLIRLGEGESENGNLDNYVDVQNISGNMKLRYIVKDYSNNYIVVESANNVKINEWNFVAVSRDGEELKIYLNGNITNFTLPWNTYTIDSDIFRLPNFNGEIDELRIWDKPMSENEMRDAEKTNMIKLDDKIIINSLREITSSSNYYIEINGKSSDIISVEASGNSGISGKVIEAYESGRGIISRVWERVKNLF